MTIAGIASAAILLVAVGTHIPGMPESMLRAMAGLKLPSFVMDPVIAWAHLLAQLVAAVLLLIPASQLIGSILAIILASSYLVISMVRQGETCRCFGSPATVTYWTVGRNAFFVGLAVLSLWPATTALLLLGVGLFSGFVVCELRQRHLS